MKDIIFTKDQHQIWRALFKNQIKNIRKFACKEFLLGFSILNLPTNKIPTIDFINKKITPLTGWKASRTKIRYSDALPWYLHFVKKEFIVTNYIRSWNEFDFTPEPDMFHDIFGHLSFLTSPAYVELFEMFSKAFVRATPKERKDIGRLAWFSYEFGLIREKGKIKIFGAGIMSSVGETMNVMSGNVPILPFTIKNVLSKNKAIHNFNKQLFIFDSLESLKSELQKFLNPISTRQIKINTTKEIKDMEMNLKNYKE